jgi:hypothetical protein
MRTLIAIGLLLFARPAVAQSGDTSTPPGFFLAARAHTGVFSGEIARRSAALRETPFGSISSSLSENGIAYGFGFELGLADLAEGRAGFPVIDFFASFDFSVLGDPANDRTLHGRHFDLGLRVPFGSGASPMVPYVDLAYTHMILVEDGYRGVEGTGVSIGGGFHLLVGPAVALRLGAPGTLGRYSKASEESMIRVEQEDTVGAANLRLACGLVVFIPVGRR